MMMQKIKIGAVTIGQSPRTDITEDAGHFFGDRVELLEFGALDRYTPEEAKQLQAEHGGVIKTMWCGELDCELKMKEEAGMTSRCVPFAQEHLADTCPICGRAAKKMIYWGVAY